jgi:hypothetical protein
MDRVKCYRGQCRVYAGHSRMKEARGSLQAGKAEGGREPQRKQSLGMEDGEQRGKDRERERGGE